MGLNTETESMIVSACLKLLELRRILAWRANQIPVKGRTFRGLRGVSDIIGVLDDGRLLAVEVKTETGRIRPEQTAFLDAVRERGGVAMIVRSVAELNENLNRELAAACVLPTNGGDRDD